MKTAVILAARKERDSEIPYPLMNFADGICLIDRNLSILKECGYEKIYVVAGFRSDLFLKYQGDGVTILRNRDYEFTASMGSLAYARITSRKIFCLWRVTLSLRRRWWSDFPHSRMATASQ